MSITELKNKITRKINNIESLETLREIEEMLEWEIQINKNGVYQLNKDQVASVRESREQIKKGHFVADEDVRKKANKWLEK